MTAPLTSLRNQVTSVFRLDTHHRATVDNTFGCMSLVAAVTSEPEPTPPTRVPREYAGRFPLYWADVAGMEQAMNHWRYRKVDPIHPTCLSLIVDYCSYYADAPCWSGPTVDPGILARIHDLRSSIKLVHTVQQLETWMRDAHDLGLEPL